MERQVGCMHCDFRVKSQRRQLFNHEGTVHGTHDMSTLTGFISLARRGRIVGDQGQWAAEAIFGRMLENLRDDFYPTIRMLIYRVHGQYPDRVQERALAKILAPHWTGSHNEPLPGAKLIHPDEFLMHLRPNPWQDSDEEDWWRRVWDTLRKMYADGMI